MVLTVILIIITFLAVVVALFGKRFWDWKDRPLIKIGFGNYEPYSIYPFLNSMGMLFRIKIVNEGKTVARNCKVKLLSVKSEERNNVLDKNEPDVLKWSSAPRDMGFRIDPERINLVSDINQLIPIFKENKDISPKGGWEFCDLFWIDSATKEVIFSSTGGRNFICEDKRYFAIIEISGDNFEPKIKEIRFYTPCKMDWTNNKILFAGIEEVKNISQLSSNCKPEPSEEPQHPEQSPSENEDN
ncbi:hypothetical protein BMS3Abin17_01365 [archaeon BMS3Abin17]|nr:hypothetical protein BMS3Abin17_01365 [archaeon BMS3Abin17]HDZ61425.1 hypothetical protein [Candidatus Pacearchaeota archaeon]